MCLITYIYRPHIKSPQKTKNKKKEKKKPEIIALAGIVNFMDLDKTRCLIKSSITSQFKR